MATVRSNKTIGTLKGTHISFQRVPPDFLKKKLAERAEKEASEMVATGPTKKLTRS